MREINFYSFHRGLPNYRFDINNSLAIYEELSKNYKVNRFDLSGSDGFRFNGININHGSILIFEFCDTKQFKVFDFGDHPYLTIELAKLENFSSAAIGQYNKDLWDQKITNLEIRNKIIPSIYPETNWQFGMANYDLVQNYRSSTQLKKDLYWRGSIYKNPNIVEFNRRETIEFISSKLKDFYFGHSPIFFDNYIEESIQYKLALCFGVGGGYTCGDFCFRDIEFYGLGIPTIRPKYAVETEDPLIPNYHYISVDCEFDETFKYKQPELLADKIISKYYEVIDNDDYLKEISNNARNWYINNISYPNITNKIIKALEL
jgi:hypothetical protein